MDSVLISFFYMKNCIFFPIPFVEDALFPSMWIFGIFIKYHMAVVHEFMIRSSVCFCASLLGVMHPSFGPVNGCLSNGSPDRTKAHGGSLNWQWPVDFGKVENTVGTVQSASCLLSHNIDDALNVFSVILSIMHRKDVIIHGNPIFFSNILL